MPKSATASHSTNKLTDEIRMVLLPFSISRCPDWG
jgi:hypothetical protein